MNNIIITTSIIPTLIKQAKQDGCNSHLTELSVLNFFADNGDINKANEISIDGIDDFIQTFCGIETEYKFITKREKLFKSWLKGKVNKSNELLNIIEKKKSFLSDFLVAWSPKFEDKLMAELRVRPNADPKVILDRITHDLIFP